MIIQFANRILIFFKKLFKKIYFKSSSIIYVWIKYIKMNLLKELSPLNASKTTLVQSKKLIQQISK